MASGLRDREVVSYDNMESNRGGNKAGIAIGIVIAMATITLAGLYAVSSNEKSAAMRQAGLSPESTAVTRTLPNIESSTRAPR